MIDSDLSEDSDSESDELKENLLLKRQGTVIEFEEIDDEFSYTKLSK